ncbi:MAG: ribonuclease HI [Candidatus Kapabacteria bacterium]|nr:ribonuclease HI [Candidatus Kapabacteria bacterium]
MNPIIIYTDGSCLNNPGRGGWAAVLNDGEDYSEISGGVVLSTNNRMEIRAAIEAIRTTPRSDARKVLLYTDSRLLVDSIMKGWAVKWQANNWKRNKNDRAENPDLWAALLAELHGRDVEFVWTKGHAGTPENERCDILAKSEAEHATESDSYYEELSRTGIPPAFAAPAMPERKKLPTAVTEAAVAQAKAPAKKDKPGKQNGKATPSLFDGDRSHARGYSEHSSQPANYEVIYEASTSTIIIRHAVNGTIRIPVTQITTILQKIKYALSKM